TPTQILFPKYVTEEQEAYVRGFSQALEELYQKQGVPLLPPMAEPDANDNLIQLPTCAGGVGGGWGYQKLTYNETKPTDYVPSEKLRMDRKRAKNRVAAHKCQQRKVQRIQDLESKVSKLKERNQILTEHASNLRVDIENLKHTISLHRSSGCTLMLS
ncbi:hypothetical protein HELRODRAFT_134516, partial [Helobdella robusta]|uniref:BZIP domain-containing protein n=1 Tax=Helobdella robusta TaxID=6412 RepID=T1EI51_HELRO